MPHWPRSRRNLLEDAGGGINPAADLGERESSGYDRGTKAFAAGEGIEIRL